MDYTAVEEFLFSVCLYDLSTRLLKKIYREDILFFVLFFFSGGSRVLEPILMGQNCLVQKTKYSFMLLHTRDLEKYQNHPFAKVSCHQRLL